MNNSDLYSSFSSISEMIEFLDELSKKADPEEVARGMSPNDTSKAEKEEEQPEEEVEGEAPPEAPAEPGMEPGSQIRIGHKEITGEEENENPEVKVSGKKQKIKIY
jgi:hypothetical protein